MWLGSQLLEGQWDSSVSLVHTRWDSGCPSCGTQSHTGGTLQSEYMLTGSGLSSAFLCNPKEDPVHSSFAFCLPIVAVLICPAYFYVCLSCIAPRMWVPWKQGLCLVNCPICALDMWWVFNKCLWEEGGWDRPQNLINFIIEFAQLYVVSCCCHQD